jgi:hypothetical protein
MVAPQGFYSNVLERIRWILAKNIALQTWFGVGDAAAAAERIFLAAVDPRFASVPESPFATVMHGDAQLVSQPGQTEQLWFPSGEVLVAFVWDIPPGLRDDSEVGNAELTFLNALGLVAEDLADIAQGEFPRIQSIMEEMPAVRNDPKDGNRTRVSELNPNGEFYTNVWRIAWGAPSGGDL